MVKSLRIAVLAGLATWLLRLLFATYRVRIERAPRDWRTMVGERPLIFAFWHNRQLLMPLMHRVARPSLRGRRLYTLISAHADGRLIAAAVRPLGIDSVAGSSSRGGQEGFRGLLDALSQGGHAAITPDGPRGPIYRCKRGVLKLAEVSGAPVVPLSWGAGSFWRFRSWDGMILPKPFSRIHLCMGEAIRPPAALSEDQEDLWLRALEQALNELAASADRAAGVRTKAPAE